MRLPPSRLDRSGSAGQTSTHRDELFAALGAQQALAAGDDQTAARRFSAMQQTL